MLLLRVAGRSHPWQPELESGAHPHLFRVIWVLGQARARGPAPPDSVASGQPISGISDGRIAWPLSTRQGGRSLVLCEDLALLRRGFLAAGTIAAQRYTPHLRQRTRTPCR